MGRDVVDFNADDSTETNTGQAILALDLLAFGDPQEFRAAVDRLAADLRGSTRMKGVERIWLPGEQSLLKEAERRRDGIPVPPALMESLSALGTRLGIAPPGQPA
ncbi:MAG TPA: Ldh family oxidoreductase, partial [Burkholderiales bacterium]|nr:Ldh family oxidoreductase [Burkholderiales bacterium]